ncbi:UNVERIFIED_CONTAM: hypothetical protein FKN15_016888 [Acipenser sinensis]
MDFNTAKKQLAKTPSIASEDTDFLMNEAERCNETLQAADLPAEESKQLHVTEDRRSRAPLQKALSQGSVLRPDGKEKYFTGRIGRSSECLAYHHSVHRTQSLSEKHSKFRRSRSVPGRSQSLSHIAGGSQCVTSEGMAGDVVEDVVGDELLLKPSSGLFHQSSLAVARATSTEKVSSTAEPDNGTLEGRENEVHKAATVLESKMPNSPSCSLKLLLSSQIENRASHISSLNAKEKIQDSKSHSNSSQVSSGSSTTGSEMGAFDYSEEKKAIEQQARGRESESDPLAFNPSAASVLQRQIVDLKSHINDLQEANENAVLELAKADEEISQLNAGMAKLKAEYEDRLQDSLQRHSIFKEKVSRKHGEPLSPVCPGNSLDLHGEVCQLRSESRKLREANHRLNEENHWLQEELWDMRRQHERLLRTILNGTTDSTERGDGSSLAQIIEHTTEHNGKVDKVTCLQSKSERLPPPAHCSCCMVIALKKKRKKEKNVDSLYNNEQRVSLGDYHCLVQELKYTEKKAIEQQARRRESESDPLAFNPSAASVLQRQIVDLKSHINDLQEANENAVLELAKADEEISQLNAGMAKLKAEYEDRLQDSLQRHNIFKEKVSRKHGEPLSPVCPGNSLDLHGEVCQLRSESRKLREANHRLNEENHWLQEELWDMRRQHERLLRTILNGTTDSTERANPAGGAPSELRADTCRGGLCPPEVSISLSSSWVKKEAGLVVGSEDTH